MGLPPAPVERKSCRNKVYVDMGETTIEEKNRFRNFRFFEKIFLYSPADRSFGGLTSVIGSYSIPENVKWKYSEKGILFEFTTLGSPPFRMFLQLAQMFPHYRFYTKCEGFSDCAYHGRECYYFGESGNMRDCTLGIGHFGEGCNRRDRCVVPFQYPKK